MASRTNSPAKSGGIHIVSGVASKPIRVDNWGNFLAQRIEALYDKQEHCDLTLRFPQGDLKAHSLVLHACTPFFTNLLKGKTTGPKILKMPPQISSSAMNVILKFVYTGRLESPFSVDSLYSTAKLLKLQVLIRLLEAQMHSAEAVAMSMSGSGQPGRRGRPPVGFYRPREPLASGYQMTNSQQLAANRSRPVRAADPPADVKPSRFELPESDEMELGVPEGMLPTPQPKRESSPQATGGSRDAMFEHLRHTPVKRPAAGAAREDSAQKRPKVEPADPPPRDEEREYYEEQQQRARLLGDHLATDGTPEQSPSTPVRPRPILKQEPTPVSSSASKKRVQFSESSQLTLTVADMGDTSELVSQLVKQHPELLRGGQTVKVRLVTQNESGSPTHTEFMVVKQQDSSLPMAKTEPNVVTQSLETPLSCSLCARKGKQADFWWADQMAKHFQDVHSDESAIDLNTLSCTACVEAGDPIDFATVTDYFAHLRDVHDNRAVTGSSTCQLCGFSANKKLQLIYHQYIQHKIQPPRYITFPKCDRCDFEAISDSEMLQHRQRRHKIGKEYRCKDCSLLFPNLSLLEGHMRTNACRRQGSEEKKKFDWKCEFCGMSFSRSYNLKGHMRAVHKMSMDRRRVINHPDPADSFKQDTAAPSPLLDPSSEAESMSTVANSVAASLSLAVDGEYMTLPDGIVPVEDENGVISYIALQPAEGEDGVGVEVPSSGGTVLTQYTVPVAVSSDGTSAESVTVRVTSATGATGPGSSAGESVLPDLASPPHITQATHFTTTTGSQVTYTLSPAPHVQLPAARRRSAAHNSSLNSSRISVSSSQITVSDLDEPGSILPDLPGDSLPAVVSQNYSQTVRLAQLQDGQIVMADGLTTGNVILAGSDEVIVAEMADGQLYELQQSGGQQLIAQPIQFSHHERHQDDTAGQQAAQDTLLLRQSVPEHDVVTTQSGDISQRVFVQDTSVPDFERVGSDEAAGQPHSDMDCDVNPRQDVLVADMSESNEFIGPDTLPETPVHSVVSTAEDARESELVGDSTSKDVLSNETSMTEEIEVEQQEEDTEMESQAEVSVAHYPRHEETVLTQTEGEDDSKISEQDHTSPSEETVVSEEQEINESVAHYPHEEETVISQEQSISTIDESIAHYAGGEQSVTRVDESVAHYPDGEQSVSRIDESVAHYPDGEQSVSRIDESVAHYPDGEQSVTRIDESVAHYPDGEQSVSRIDESVAHYPDGEQSVTRIDESVAHYPDGEQSVSRIDESVAHYPDGEQSVTRIDESVAHYPDGEGNVSSYAPGEETIASNEPSDKPEGEEESSGAVQDASAVESATELSESVSADIAAQQEPSAVNGGSPVPEISGTGADDAPVVFDAAAKDQSAAATGDDSPPSAGDSAPSGAV